MVTRRFAWLVTVVMLALNLRAFNEGQRGTDQGAQSIGIPTRDTMEKPSHFHRLFTGSIGPHKIWMKLRRHSEHLSGWYLYEKDGERLSDWNLYEEENKMREERGTRNYLSVEGTIDKEGRLTLKEVDGPKQTGHFAGSLQRETAGIEPSWQLTGTWSQANNSKALPFSLTEQRFDLGSGLQLATKEKTEENEKLKYTIEARFPQIVGAPAARGASFNQGVHALVVKETDKFKRGVAKVRQELQNDPAVPGEARSI